MSLEQFESNGADQSFGSLRLNEIQLNEMQREDFLALAAGLRQFNAQQATLSMTPMAVISARYAPEYPSLMAIE